MADTRPTKVSFLKAVWLCLLALFKPKKFIEEEKKDIQARNNYLNTPEPEERILIVRRAFFKSFLYVAFSAAIGYILAFTSHKLGFCSTEETVTYLQVIGASLLLWGTLFVRGWEIQSHAGVLFSERVNRWLYRTLYCLGTVIIVCSLTFQRCTS